MDFNGDYPGSKVKRLRVEDDAEIDGDTEIKGDLVVDGTATFSGGVIIDTDRVYTVDGTEPLPSYSWKDEKSLGFYRSAPGETSFASGGTKRVRLSGTDSEYYVPLKTPSLQVTGTSSFGATINCVSVNGSGSGNFSNITTSSIGSTLQDLKVNGDITAVDLKASGTLPITLTSTSSSVTVRSFPTEVKLTVGGTETVNFRSSGTLFLQPVTASTVSTTTLVATNSTLGSASASSVTTTSFTSTNSTLGTATATSLTTGTLNSTSTTRLGGVPNVLSTNAADIYGPVGMAIAGPNKAYLFNCYFDSKTGNFKNIQAGRGGLMKHDSGTGNWILCLSSNNPASPDQPLTLTDCVNVTSAGNIIIPGNLSAFSVSCDTLSASNITYGTPTYWRGPLTDVKTGFSGGFQFWPISTTPDDSSDITDSNPGVKIGSDGWYIITARGISDTSADGTFRYMYIFAASGGPIGQGYTSVYATTEPIFFSATGFVYLQSGDTIFVYLYSDTNNPVIFIGGSITIRKIQL